jgi:hypothetical protein
MILKFWPTYARTNRLTIGGVEEIFTIENNILETMIMSLQKLVCLRAKNYSCLCPQLGVHDLNGAQVFFFLVLVHVATTQSKELPLPHNTSYHGFCYL